LFAFLIIIAYFWAVPRGAFGFAFAVHLWLHLLFLHFPFFFVYHPPPLESFHFRLLAAAG